MTILAKADGAVPDLPPHLDYRNLNDDVSRLLGHSDWNERRLALKMEGVKPAHLMMALQHLRDPAAPKNHGRYFDHEAGKAFLAQAVLEHSEMGGDIADHIAQDPGLAWLWHPRSQWTSTQVDNKPMGLAGEWNQYHDPVSRAIETAAKHRVLAPIAAHLAMTDHQERPKVLDDVADILWRDMERGQWKPATDPDGNVTNPDPQQLAGPRQCYPLLMQLAFQEHASQALVDQVGVRAAKYLTDEGNLYGGEAQTLARLIQHKVSAGVAESLHDHERFAFQALKNGALARERPQVIDNAIRKAVSLSDQMAPKSHRDQLDPGYVGHLSDTAVFARKRLAAVAENPGLSDSHLHTLIDGAMDHGEETFAPIAGHVNLKSDHLQQMVSKVMAWRNTLPGMASHYATMLSVHPLMDDETRIKLIDHGFGQSVYGASNELSRELTERGLKSPDRDIRLLALEQIQARPEDRAALFSDEDRHIAYAAAKNQAGQWNAAYAKTALASPHREVQDLGLKQADVPTLMSVLTGGTPLAGPTGTPRLLPRQLQAIVEREDLPAEALPLAVSAMTQLGAVPGAEKGKFMLSVLNHPNATPATAEHAVLNGPLDETGMVSSVDDHLMGQISRHKMIGTAVFDKMAAEGGMGQQRIAARSTRTSPAALRKLWDKTWSTDPVSTKGLSIDQVRAQQNVFANSRHKQMVRHWILENPTTPADVIEHAAQLADVKGNNGLNEHTIISHPNVSPTVLEKLARSKHVEPSARERAKTEMLHHFPDKGYKEQVGVRIGKGGLGKLRRARDYILEQNPKGRTLKPAALLHMPSDYSVGRAANGDISADLLQAHIDAQPVSTWNVSHTKWTGGQRHSEEPSKVFQMNITTDHVRQLKEAGVYGTFREMMDASRHSKHPVTDHSIGWVRYTGQSTKAKPPAPPAVTMQALRNEHNRVLGIMDDALPAGQRLPDDVSNHSVDFRGLLNFPSEGAAVPSPELLNQLKNHPFMAHAQQHVQDAFGLFDPKPTEIPGTPGYFVDEVQSDFGQSFVQQAKGQMRAQAMEQAQARGMTHEQARIHVENEMGRAAAVAESKFPEEHYQKISQILFNGRHPNEVLAEGFMQWLRDKGKHKATVQWHTPESKGPISGMKRVTDGKAVALPAAPTRAELLQAIASKHGQERAYPGHFLTTYEKIPKSLGLTPSTYGTLQTQAAPSHPHLKPQVIDETGMPLAPGAPPRPPAPTFEGKVRKAEEPDAPPVDGDGDQGTTRVGQSVTSHCSRKWENPDGWHVPEAPSPATVTHVFVDHAHPTHKVYAVKVRHEVSNYAHDAGEERTYVRHGQKWYGLEQLRDPGPEPEAESAQYVHDWLRARVQYGDRYPGIESAHVFSGPLWENIIDDQYQLEFKPYQWPVEKSEPWLLDELQLVKFEDQLAAWEPLGKAFISKESLLRRSWRSPWQKAFEAAGFISGIEPEEQQVLHANWENDGDPVGAALQAHQLAVTPELRESVKAVQGIQGAAQRGLQAKPASDLTKVQSVQPAVPEAAQAAQAIARAYHAEDVHPVSLGGKHSKGSCLARDPQTANLYFLKPGSGPLSPIVGENEETASQSQREACFAQVARLWGLDGDLPRADLLLLDGKQIACIEWLPPEEWQQLEKSMEEDQGSAVRILEPYRERGRLHQWGVMDFVLANGDRHFGNIMVDERDQAKLIDAGSAFAGESFDPAHDRASFVPCYLRASVPMKTNFNKLPLARKLTGMAHASVEGRQVLKTWLAGLDEALLTTKLTEYGINPAPSVARLRLVKSLTVVEPLDDAINRLWVTV